MGRHGQRRPGPDAAARKGLPYTAIDADLLYSATELTLCPAVMRSGCEAHAVPPL
jgi:hypothetical protein